MNRHSLITFAATTLLLVSTNTAASAQVCPNVDVFEFASNNCSNPLPTSLLPGTMPLLTVGSFVGGSDYWTVDLGPYEGVNIDVEFAHFAGNIDARLWNENCSTLLALSSSTTNDEQLFYRNTSSSPIRIKLEVFRLPSPTICTDYALHTTYHQGRCSDPTGDDYEPFGGDCASGPPLGLPMGFTDELTVGGFTDEQDCWYLSLGPLESVTVDASTLHPWGGVDLFLREFGVATPVASSTNASGDESISFTNSEYLTRDFFLEVAMQSSPTTTCVEYSLQAAVLPPWICQQPADAHEVSQLGCPAPTLATLPLGRTDNLSCGTGVGGPDQFYCHLTPGAGLTVELLWAPDIGDVTIMLTQADCLVLDVDPSTSGHEVVSYVNDGYDAQTVAVFISSDSGSCNPYSLIATTTPGPPPIGETRCVPDFLSNPCPCGNDSYHGSREGCWHSLGNGGVLTAKGSTSVAADDIEFWVRYVIPNQPAMIVQGATLQQVQFKDGILCMGNPTERIEILHTDAEGNARTSGSIVTQGDIAPGDMRWYQAWYRDPGGVSPCGTGSNFTAGLELIFVP